MIPAAGFAGWAVNRVGPAEFAGAGVGHGALAAVLAGCVCDGRRRERKVAE